ncbi:hypothetical protein H6G54_12090 [Anabaena cylindrica FACHB-243]|uniref:Uncharacterized protein n=1 Tax=Anabaena cylindrica (strain ATCC 27899 / PCC 7122) TaxID=272123 RepID=K9ZCK7_ANACC|nr:MULTISPECIES: hypothetical protein [Anabaena]AFZ56911.1 hypothetical protein Anacy_1400 [Anabaena cylindrica PCC 7122]MBD2418423.1 hypothetical protein [Anabaena cylindrica FACHB-243]MBY5284371.1 hypothetical protein [Anabaena sp. CCAP 1446/1C]MBY5307646.1 hypothetical protein [Anabaena sp. CCAP 1446/1C]MCM2409394.1 hypothetical protein [Anabaena sp. CCAP 1446/1C]
MIEQILETQIIICHSLSEDEIQDLIMREEISSLATQRFIKGEISFRDFLEFMEIAGINIDDYLQLANDNAQSIGF